VSYHTLQEAITGLNQLKQAIDALRKHIRVLRASQSSFDARDLLELSMELERERAGLEAALRGLQAQGRSAALRVGRPGPGLAPGGNLGVEVKGLAGHVGREIQLLGNEIRIFNGEQSERMNDPTRTSTGSPDEAVEVFWALIDGLFDISGKLLGRKRVPRIPRKNV
jgi:hypothetical protein